MADPLITHQDLVRTVDTLEVMHRTMQHARADIVQSVTNEELEDGLEKTIMLCTLLRSRVTK